VRAASVRTAQERRAFQGQVAAGKRAAQERRAAEAQRAEEQRAAQERREAEEQRASEDWRATVEWKATVERKAAHGRWHPNGIQWAVIWTAVLLGLLFAANGGELLGFGGPLLIGALLVWQLESKRTD